MEATTSSSTKPLLPSRASYTHTLYRTGDKLKSFRSYLRWMCLDQSDTRHTIVS
ncbi:hypothetical protein B296_00045722 [Ensete ventricosum]|uniref:Uncharacterized protein n=1 Tax=Ensete ventricosum TaxID=4639 RepID=A0A426XWZ6_ENSVE|nr:hypothetical protein B296_00045722 [Ensete ventricosum]